MDSASHDILVTAVTIVSGGTMLLIASRRLGIPAIVVLLFGGVLLGPQVAGLIKPESFGNGLLVLVELSVGLILFEGGLTLHVKGYRSAPDMIKRLLTIGVLTTWLLTTLLVRLLVGLPWPQAVMAGSLVIVTGPTVIAPLLKRIRVTNRLYSILKWEAVLIDPIGVFIAVLCFEWVSDYSAPKAILNLGVRVGAGLGIGALGGAVIFFAIRRRIVPPDLVNIFALAGAVLVFGLTEAVISKAGLLAVTVAGFGLGLAAKNELREVRRFKAEVTDLLIATLFMLLAARLEIEQFGEFGIRGGLAVLGVLFLVRPVCVFLCAIGLEVTPGERAFLSWVAPRGIVAASMASLFAISLEHRGVAQARFVETFTYSVIISTILVQGTTAGMVARLLRVLRPDPTGWLIVGAHVFARRVASFIRDATGRSVVMVDTSATLVHEAIAEGHQALREDARDVEVAEKHQLLDLGYVLALTDNEDLNARVCELWRDVVGHDNVYRCAAGGLPAKDTSADGAGAVVWPALPRPSTLSSEIGQGTTTVMDVPPEAEAPYGATLLATYDGKSIRLPQGETDEVDRGGQRALYVRRYRDALRNSVRPGMVLRIDTPVTMESLLETMLARLVQTVPALAREDLLPAMLERERAFPAAIGEGVAVPHAYSAELPDQVCAVAIVEQGVEYAGTDDPVHVVFMVISPRNDPKAHLTLLAEIARFIMNAETREALRAAKTEDDVMRVLRRRVTPSRRSG